MLFSEGFLFYAEYNLRLFFKLLFVKKDVLLANDLDTLLPNFLVSRLQRKKLVFDSHELFSEIPELINRPRVKRFWNWLEKRIIPKLKNCYTVSESIASHYKNLYTTDFQVIKNYPKKGNNEFKKFDFPFDVLGNKLIIYQGAVNVGRGLELMIEAMKLIDNAIFLIVGDGDITEELQLKVSKQTLENKVKFLGKIPPETLRSITAIVDIGISLEEDLGLNYRYALPNKLFDYIQAKVPVLVSDLPEIRKIAENYDVGLILKDRTPESLANAIDHILKKDKSNWQNQLNKAANELIWEKESAKLKTLFKKLK